MGRNVKKIVNMGCVKFLAKYQINHCSAGSPCPANFESTKNRGAQRPRTTMDSKKLVPKTLHTRQYDAHFNLNKH